MLYDGQDRMPRPTFLREYHIDGSTEKRARAEGLPWPPWRVMGARVYYSRQLVTRWFQEQTGVFSGEAAQTPDDDELAAVGGDAP